MTGKPRRASDLVFDFFEDAFERGEFGVCDGALQCLDADRLPSTILVAILAVTFPAKEQLKHRKSFFASAARKLGQNRTPDEVDKLIARYR